MVPAGGEEARCGGEGRCEEVASKVKHSTGGALMDPAWVLVKVSGEEKELGSRGQAGQ